MVPKHFFRIKIKMNKTGGIFKIVNFYSRKVCGDMEYYCPGNRL